MSKFSVRRQTFQQVLHHRNVLAHLLLLLPRIDGAQAPHHLLVKAASRPRGRHPCHRIVDWRCCYATPCEEATKRSDPVVGIGCVVDESGGPQPLRDCGKAGPHCLLQV